MTAAFLSKYFPVSIKDMLNRDKTDRYYGGGRLQLRAWLYLNEWELDRVVAERRDRVRNNGHVFILEYNGKTVRLYRDNEYYGMYSLDQKC